MSSKRSPLTPYKTSLEHVPSHIKAQLDIVLDLVHQHIKKNVAMIWLFGSYARGDAINDRRVDPETGMVSEYYSDVDVLVIVSGKYTMQKEKWWSRLDQSIREHPEITSSIHLIRESIKRAGEALQHSEYFYLDVVKEGIVLYGKDTVLPEPREFSIEKRRAFAIDYLERFYQRANASQISLEVHYQLKDFASAMYSIHQMSERLFYAYLLVFTHYKPRSHKLCDLRERVATINTQITTIFPLRNKQEEMRFQFLNDAYVDSRYKDIYEVDPEVMDYLIERMSEFQSWVLSESLQMIDDFIPEKNYSKDFEQPGKILNLHTLKTEKIPKATIQLQLEQLKVLEKEKNQVQEKATEWKISSLTEREAKEAALKREQESLIREKKQREEKEASLLREQALLKKLRDAGIEP